MAALVDVQDDLGRIELHKVENTEAAETLLDAGSNINHQDAQGLTPLHNATYHNNGKLVTLLLQRGANPNLKSKNQETPLDFAIDSHHLELVRLLLVDGKADANVKGENGWTALHGAASSNRKTTIEMVELLLSSGANAGAKTDSGQYPDEVAEQPAVVSLLANAKIQALANEAILQDPDAINKTDELGRTALHTSILGVDMVKSKALLMAGARVDAPDNYGNTPLHNAVYHRSVDAVKLLLEYKEMGVEQALGLRSLEGDSVLDYACANVSIEIVKLLVNSGANVNDCDTRGWGCLHNACELGPKGAELVEFLVVDCLANPMLTTSDGKLPVDITREPAIKLTLMRAMKQSNLDHEFLDGGIEF